MLHEKHRHRGVAPDRRPLLPRGAGFSQAKEAAPSQDSNAGTTGIRPGRVAVTLVHQFSAATRTAHRRSQESLTRTAQVSPVAATKERLQSNPPILESKSLWVQRPRPTRVANRATRARRGRKQEKTQSRSLPSVFGSAAPAHGFTHTVSPTACRFPPPTPDRSVTGASPPTAKK